MAVISIGLVFKCWLVVDDSVSLQRSCVIKVHQMWRDGPFDRHFLSSLAYCSLSLFCYGGCGKIWTMDDM